MSRSFPWPGPVGSALAAALVAVLVYANALGNDFAYDDVHIVVEDETLAEPRAFPERLLEPYWPDDAAGDLGLWRPLTTAALGLQRRVFGLEAAGFHAVNVALHGVVTALVVVLASGLVGAPVALLAGLLFAVHPVHVEAVANVVGLAELLAAVPYLAACVVFLRATRAGPSAHSRHSVVADLHGGPGAEAGHGLGSRPGSDSGSGAWPAPPPWAVAAVAVLYALAFLTKESAVTLPAALLLLDLVRRPVALRETTAWLRARAPLLVVLALTAGAVLALRWLVLDSVASPDPPLGARRLLETPRIFTLGVIWLHYARLLVLPFELSADYSPGVIPVLTVWTGAAMAGVAIALAALGGSLGAWRTAKSGEGSGDGSHDGSDRGEARGAVPPGRLPALALVWFLVTVSPVSNVLFVSGVLLAERTLYLPSVGFVVLAAWALHALMRARPGPGGALVLLVLGTFAVRSWTRTPTWENTERVFLTLAEERPEAGRAQWMVGDMLASRGEVARARRYWSRAVGLLDSSPWLLREVGWGAVERGDARLGEFLLLRAWEEESTGKITVARRLALLYARQGRHDEAVTFARRVVERDPANPAFWHLLAGSLEAMGRYEDALAARLRVIEVGEDPWQQWLSLARLHLTLGDSAAATAALAEARERAGTEAERAAVEDGFTPLTGPGAGGGEG